MDCRDPRDRSRVSFVPQVVNPSVKRVLDVYKWQFSFELLFVVSRNRVDDYRKQPPNTKEGE